MLISTDIGRVWPQVSPITAVARQGAAALLRADLEQRGVRTRLREGSCKRRQVLQRGGSPRAAICGPAGRALEVAAAGDGRAKSGSRNGKQSASGKATRSGRASGSGGASSDKAERLKAGELEPLVMAFLKKNADSAPHGPGKVAKALGRSSGAVGNCLARLTKEKKAKQVSDKPLQYDLAT